MHPYKVHVVHMHLNGTGLSTFKYIYSYINANFVFYQIRNLLKFLMYRCYNTMV